MIKKNTLRKKGIEMEFHVIDFEGNLSYEGYDMCQHLHWVHKEIGVSMIEIVTDPFEELCDLKEDLFEKIRIVSAILKTKNLTLCPTSKLGNEPFVMRNDEKYMIKKNLLGEDIEIATNVCGTHVHTDKPENENELIKTYNALIALDPFFTILSSSPYFNCKLFGNNSRVHFYRNQLYGKFPQIGQLNSFLNKENVTETLLNTEIVINKGVLQESNSEVLQQCVILKACTPVRINTFTIESRSCDTTLPSLAIAFAGIIKGIEMSSIKHPSHDFLKKIEYMGSKEGIKNTLVKTYLLELVQIAKNNLQNKEKIFLAPIEKVLYDEKTFSNEIANQIESKEQAEYFDIQVMRKFAAKRLQEDVESFNIC